MVRINRYRGEKLFQYVCLIVLVSLGGLIFNKARHLVTKVKLANEVIVLHREKAWIEAESTLNEARAYNWFEYKEEELVQYEESLQWISQYRGFLEQLEEDMKELTIDEANYTQFVALYEAYKKSGVEKLAEWQKTYLFAYYPVEEEIDRIWKKYRSLMSSYLSNPLEENWEWAKRNIDDVPEVYWKDRSEVEALFVTCDTLLFEEATSKDDTFGAFSQLIEQMNVICEVNRAAGHTSEWLGEMLRPYINELFRVKSSESIDTFTLYLSLYRSSALNVYKDKRVEEIAADFVVSKEKEVKQLVNEKAYEEAITLLKKLEYFGKYEEEIQKIEDYQKYEEPERLLTWPIEEYGFIQKGSEAFESHHYVVAFNQVVGKLEMLLIKGDRERYDVQRFELSMDGEGIEEVQVVNDLLVMMKEGMSRKVRYQIVGMEDGQLKCLLDLEADGLEIEEEGMKLRVRHPINEEEEADYYYSYSNGSYESMGIAYTEVAFKEIEKVMKVGDLIKFHCYVPEEVAGETAFGMFIEENLYDPRYAVYLYRKDGGLISEGEYDMIGEYVNQDVYEDEVTGEQRILPHIKIIELERKV